MWRSLDMVSGEYAVGAATHYTNHDDLGNAEATAQLGLVPLARMLKRLVAGTIDV